MMARNKFNVDETLSQSFNLEMTKRSFVYVRQEKVRFLIAIAFQTLAVLAALCGPLCSAHALDVAVPNGDVHLLLLCVAGLLASVAVNIFFVTLSSRITAIIGQNIIRNLRRDLYAHLQQLSFDYYDSRPHGKILVRIINYVNSVSNLLSNGLINLLLQFINLIFIAIFMFITHLQLACVVLVGLPFAVGFVRVIKPAQRRGWQAYSNKSSNMNAYLNESIVCMRISQLFSREQFNTKTYEQLTNESKKAWYTASYPSISVGPAIELIRKLVTVLVIAYGIYWANPMVSVGVLIAMMQYCARFWQPINQIANFYNSFINNMAYLERIFEAIDEPVLIQNKPNAITLPPIKGDVTFEDVTFCYEKGVWVLNDVSFDVKAGQSIALVGSTGSGKSTIINLISRFYDCTEGCVKIDGYDVSDVTLNSLRTQMGLMMQDSFVFSASILDNLRYGNLEATDEELKAAAELVCADSFIQSLPQGYDTIMSEGGSMLSQGQKQLLSLARTMASNPKILILDEATSSVDTKTERDLQKGLDRALKGRTSFIVAHRLSTIKACDKIMFVQDGRILEVGSHQELMEKNGLYCNLCKQQ